MLWMISASLAHGSSERQIVACRVGFGAVELATDVVVHCQRILIGASGASGESLSSESTQAARGRGNFRAEELRESELYHPSPPRMNRDELEPYRTRHLSVVLRSTYKEPRRQPPRHAPSAGFGTTSVAR